MIARVCRIMAAGTLATLSAGAFAAPLAAQEFPAARVVTTVNRDDLVAVVKALGHSVREASETGDPFISAQTPDGAVYLLFGTACGINDVPGCQGIVVQVRYNLPPGTTPATLVRANLEQSAVTAVADFEAKTLAFMRYVVLDEGVTMANIRANVDVLLAVHRDAYPVAAGQR